MRMKASDFKDWLKGKNIAVIGLGISGEGVLETLKRLDVRAYIFDRKRPDALSYGEYVSLEEADSLHFDLAVISPGVPLTSAEAQYFIEHSIELIGEIEFSYRLTDKEYVCISGTNGKTTTTSLCGEIFARYTNSKVVGNIGIAAAPYTLNDYELFVAEISSFQIETLKAFRPKICALLNITPDHLDRHGTFDNYIELKLNLLRRAEVQIVNADCPVLTERVTEDDFPGVYRFSTKERRNRGAFVSDGKIYVAGLPARNPSAENPSAENPCAAGERTAKSTSAEASGAISTVTLPAAEAPGATVPKASVKVSSVKAVVSSSVSDCETDGVTEPEFICELSDIHLMGEHNVENVLAAVLIARLYGVPAERIRQSVIDFRAVEHRIEYVRTVDGVRFYNDSKGTNPDSTIKAVEAMDAPCHLIAGGYEKNSDFTELLEIGKGKIASLSLIGVTAERIRTCARTLGYREDGICIYETLKEAVNGAFANAREGEIVLLSPASASWGMYRNFEERGRDFKSSVMEINGKLDE